MTELELAVVRFIVNYNKFIIIILVHNTEKLSINILVSTIISIIVNSLKMMMLRFRQLYGWQLWWRTWNLFLCGVVNFIFCINSHLLFLCVHFSICGTLHSVDQFLNIKLTDISVTDAEKYPHMVSIKYVPVTGKYYNPP